MEMLIEIEKKQAKKLKLFMSMLSAFESYESDLSKKTLIEKSIENFNEIPYYKRWKIYSLVKNEKFKDLATEIRNNFSKFKARTNDLFKEECESIGMRMGARKISATELAILRTEYTAYRKRLKQSVQTTNLML